MSRIRRIAPGLGRGGLIGNTEGPESYLRELDVIPSRFCRASGGTETVITQGGQFYRVHTFTDVGSGSLTFTRGGAVEYLVVGGGGGGGGAATYNRGGGGGGAGGYRSGTLLVSQSTLEAVVGQGGNGASAIAGGNDHSNGASSYFSAIESAGGGRAGDKQQAAPLADGGDGGSGGGASSVLSGTVGTGGSGNVPSVSPVQGYDGGDGTAASGGGGGGGATAAGANGSSGGGAGGAGASNAISGSTVTYSTGGDGGASTGDTNGANALANTGDGGNGGDGTSSTTPADADIGGGSGGSGIVIARYRITPAEYFQGLDPDAAAYIQAVEAADGQKLENSVVLAIDSFVQTLKADGNWDAIKASCILCGARTLAGALVPLKGAAPTNYNFVGLGTDYTRDGGLQGDGSTKYLDSGRDVLSDDKDDCHLSVWQTSLHNDGTNFGTAIGVNDTLGSISQIVSRSSDSGLLLRIRDASNLISGVTATGFYGGSRSNPGAKTNRYGGSSFNVNVASVTPQPGNIYVFALNRIGVGAETFSNGTAAFYSIGEAVDLAALDTAVSTLVSEIGAAV